MTKILFMKKDRSAGRLILFTVVSFVYYLLFIIYY
jgi:hypothetical protein